MKVALFLLLFDDKCFINNNNGTVQDIKNIIVNIWFFMKLVEHTPNQNQKEKDIRILSGVSRLVIIIVLE
jgi:hypothetical protein